jgi:hypothetical protein
VTSSAAASPVLKTPELIFWPGSLVSRGYAAIIEAAFAGGYTGLAISPIMISKLYAAGRVPADILDEAEDHHIVLGQLDGVSTGRRFGTRRLRFLHYEFFEFSSERCLDMASVLGLSRVD